MLLAEGSSSVAAYLLGAFGFAVITVGVFVVNKTRR